MRAVVPCSKMKRIAFCSWESSLGAICHRRRLFQNFSALSCLQKASLIINNSTVATVNSTREPEAADFEKKMYEAPSNHSAYQREFPLHDAAMRENIVDMRRLLKTMSPSSLDSCLWSPLQRA
ncbi:MAG: hypothetical protein ACK56I_18465, partial [bacterium]